MNTYSTVSVLKNPKKYNSGDSDLAVFDCFGEAGLSMMLYTPLIHRVEHLVRVVNNLNGASFLLPVHS